MNKKSIIYIGGSKPQIAGILCAKSSGLNVVVTDQSLSAPANHVADQFKNIAADDIKELIKLATELNNKDGLAGAYGVADYAYSAIGQIYDKLGLPYGSKDLFDKMSNKNISRKIWQSNGINLPKGITTSNNNIDASDITFPVIVKPSNSYNSQGLKTVRKYEDLQKALNSAFEYSQNVIIEELIEGRHFNVDMVFIDGKVFPAGITERFFDNNSHQALSGIQGIEFDGVYSKSLYNIVLSACKVIGFNYGPVTADIIFKDNNLYILEISPHFHAISISSLIKADSILKGWFSYLYEDKNWRSYMNLTSKIYGAYFYILSENEGTIIDIQGINLLKSISGFSKIELKYNVGSFIKKKKNEKIYCGMVLLKSTSYKELYNSLNYLQNNIRVITNEK